MRLVSNFHDYYDGVIKNASHDTTHTFIRKTERIGTLETNYLTYWSFSIKGDADYLVFQEIVGFCGKLYPMLKIAITPFSPYEISGEHCVYSLESFEKILPLEKLVPEKNSLSYFIPLNERIPEWFSGILYPRWSLRSHQVNIYQNSKLNNLFLDKSVSYFHVHGVRDIVIDAYPILKDLEFYQVFDSFTCFQKIEQFLTNELVKPDLVDVEISDVLKAESHGFDKFSFRKDPTKRNR